MSERWRRATSARSPGRRALGPGTGRPSVPARSVLVESECGELLDAFMGAGDREKPLGVTEECVLHSGRLDEIGSLESAPRGRQVAPVLERAELAGHGFKAEALALGVDHEQRVSGLGYEHLLPGSVDRQLDDA